MGKRKKPRCFVAMAFDREDTDRLYDRVIAPVLRRNNVIPVIINRRQSNQDINIQIIDGLRECDFCIADLTYARPSVYFEAGFAQRNVDVIYTARQDHLKKNQPEDKRIHFDLQMKPLVVWKDPDDSAFEAKLEKRLKATALRRWEAQRRAGEREARATEAFSSLSVYDKLALIRKKGIRRARTYGFRLWHVFEPFPHTYTREPVRVYRDPSQHARADYVFVGWRTRRRDLQIISISAVESMTGSVVRDYVGYHFGRGGTVRYLNKIKKHERRAPGELEEHHVFFCLNRTPRTRVTSNLRYLAWDEKRDGFSFQATDPLIVVRPTDDRISRRVFFYFPSSIRSELQVSTRLDEILGNLNDLG